jgi:hypothetical protein
VLAPEGEPIEFLYRGTRFHVHAIVSRWRESGGWWNRINDGNFHNFAPHQSGKEIQGEALSPVGELAIFDDGARALWRVEAAPVGALATFEIEFDELTKKWLIRPSSRAGGGG